MSVQNTAARLKAAAGTGEVLTIIYRAGSQPGAKREIAVRHVRGDGKISADDLATGHAKTYRIADIEIIDAGAVAPEYDVDTYRRSRAPRNRPAGGSREQSVLGGILALALLAGLAWQAYNHFLGTSPAERAYMAEHGPRDPAGVVGAPFVSWSRTAGADTELIVRGTGAYSANAGPFDAIGSYAKVFGGWMARHPAARMPDRDLVVVYNSELTDRYGKVTTEPTVMLRISRAHLDRMQWETIFPWQVIALGRPVLIHPALHPDRRKWCSEPQRVLVEFCSGLLTRRE